MNKNTFSLKILHDDNPSNPFEEWDSEPPLLYVSSETTTHYGTESLAKTLLDTISDHKLVRLWMTINKSNSNILDIIDFTENKKPYGYTKAEYIREQLLHGNELTELETLQLICDLTKTPYLSAPSRGYNIDTLIVLSPEYIERISATPEHYQDILKSTKKLFDAWVW